MDQVKLKSDIAKWQTFQLAAATLGATAGIVYSIYMKRNFIRGVGNFFLGSMIIGGITAVYTMPKIAQAQTELTSQQ